MSDQAQVLLQIGKFKRLPLNRAQKIAREHRVSVENGLYPRQAIAEANTLGMTVSELVLQFRTSYLPRKSESTQSSYGFALDKYNLLDLGGKDISSLTEGQVTSWHHSFALPIAANRYLAALSSLITYGINQLGLQVANPCLSVARNSENPWLRDISIDELKAIGDARLELGGTRTSASSRRPCSAVDLSPRCWYSAGERAPTWTRATPSSLTAKARSPAPNAWNCLPPP